MLLLCIDEVVVLVLVKHVLTKQFVMIVDNVYYTGSV